MLACRCKEWCLIPVRVVTVCMISPQEVMSRSRQGSLQVSLEMRVVTGVINQPIVVSVNVEADMRP